MSYARFAIATFAERKPSPRRFGHVALYDLNQARTSACWGGQEQGDACLNHGACRPQTHLQPRRVREVALRRLRVVVPAVTHGAAWGADGEPATVELVSRAIPELGCFIHDLSGSEVGVVRRTQGRW